MSGRAATGGRFITSVDLNSALFRRLHRIIVLQLILDLLTEAFFSLLVLRVLLAKLICHILRVVMGQIVAKTDFFLTNLNLDLDRLLIAALLQLRLLVVLHFCFQAKARL